LKFFYGAETKVLGTLDAVISFNGKSQGKKRTAFGSPLKSFVSIQKMVMLFFPNKSGYRSHCSSE